LRTGQDVAAAEDALQQRGRPLAVQRGHQYAGTGDGDRDRSAGLRQPLLHDTFSRCGPRSGGGGGGRHRRVERLDPQSGCSADQVCRALALVTRVPEIDHRPVEPDTRVRAGIEVDDVPATWNLDLVAVV